MAKKKYTSEEIRERNFQRLTGKTREEYQNEWRSANSNLYETRARYLQRELDNKTPTTEAPNYETASPDYKFTAEKPIKQNYVRDILSNPHTGSPWDSNNAVYDMDKYNEDLAKYNTAVSEANKRAISDITKKDQQGEALKGLPSLTQQNMINEMKPHIETDSFQRMKNIVAAEREKNPEAFEKAVAKGKSEAEKHSYYNTMSGDERTELAYLIGSGNKTNLEAYLKSGESTFKQKESDRNALAVKKKAEQNPAFGVAANLAGGIVSPTSYIGEVVNQGAGLFTGVNEPLPEYSKWNAAARIEKSSREGLTEGKSETPAFLINVGLSIGQNLVRLPLSIFGGGTGEVLSLVSMASSAAGQTVYEAVQRGATGGQALLLGTVAGGVEYLTEKISLDKLLTLGKDSVRIFSKEAAQGIVRQMVSEGGEEMISEVANIIADSLIMGDKSELISMYNSYLESGMSKRDAEANTIWHTVLNIGLAGLGGALSGGVLGGGGTVVGAVNRNLGSETQAAVKDIGVENLIAEGKTYEGTAAQKLAQNAEKKISDGKKVSAYAKGQLYNESRIANEEQLKRLRAELEKEDKSAPVEEETGAQAVKQSETEGKAGAFTFEKAEPVKAKTFLPNEATAIERFDALGEKGKKGYKQLIERYSNEEGFNEESFAKKFERAYVLGHSRMTENQVRRSVGENFFKDPISFHAFYNGQNDAENELSSAQNSVKFKGVPLAGTEKGLVKNEIAEALNSNIANTWDKVARNLNVKIELVDSIGENVNVLGKYSNGVIQVNVNSDRAIYGVAAHEITHRIKEVAPEAYESFKTEVSAALGSEYEARFNDVAARYRTTGEKTNTEIEEEVIAEYAEELINSPEKFEALANRDTTLAQRLVTVFKEFIEKIKTALGKGTSAEVDEFDKLVKSWENAYDKAVSAVKKTKGSTAKNESSKMALVGTLKDGTKVYESDFDESVSYKQRLNAFKENIEMIFQFGKVTMKTPNKRISIMADEHTFGETFYGGRKDHIKTKAEQKALSKMLFDLVEILEDSKIVGTEPDTKTNGVHKDTKYWYYYKNDIIFDGKPVTVTFDVRDEGKAQYVYFVDVYEKGEKANRAGPNLTEKSKNSHKYTPPSPDSIIVEKDGRVVTLKERKTEQKEKTALRRDLVEMNEDELRERVSELEQQNQNLAKSVYEGVITPSKTKMMDISKRLIDKYGSKYAHTSLAKGLFDRLVEIDTGYDKNGKALSQWEIERNLRNTLRPVIQEAVEVDSERYDELADVRKAVRGSEVRITREDSHDFGSDKDFQDYRRSIMGRIPSIKVVDDNTANIDSVYFALNDKFGDYIFPSEITSGADQLRVMAEVYDIAKATEKNIYEGHESFVLNALIDDVYDEYQALRHSALGERTSDIRTRGRLEILKERGKQNKENQELFQKIREDGRKTVAEWKANAKKEIAALEKEIKEKNKNELETLERELKKTNKEQLQREKERLQEEFKANAKLMRAKFAEKQRMARDNKTKTPVIKSFEGAAKYLFEFGNKMLSVEIKQYLEDKVVGKMRAYTQDPEAVPTMQVLEHFVEKLITENPNVTWSDEVEARQELFTKKQISFIDVHTNRSDDVIDQIDFIARVLRDISMDKEMNFSKMAENAVQDMNNAISDKKASKFKSKGLAASLRENFMTPRSFLRYVGGYFDGVFDEVYDMLESGENKARLIRRDLRDMFSGFTASKSYKDFQTKKITLSVGKDFTSRDPSLTEITITPDMLVALVKHSENEQNMYHIEPNGTMNGIKIPSVEKINKGDTDSAWNIAPVVNFTKEQITSLAKKHLTEFDKNFLSVYTEFADVRCKKLLNDASMDAYGTIVAPVDKYMHIRLDPGFKGSQTAQLFGEDKESKKISSSGSLKERAKQSSRVMLLEPLSLAIKDQINTVSEYAGKAGVLQRIDKMTKTEVVSKGNNTTFLNTLRSRWGSFGLKNWNNILYDYNGNSRSEYDSFAKLRSNYAVARLGFNIKTIAVQPSAALAAYAELGFDTAVGKPKGKLLTLKDIAPYTARATDRAEGLISAELAEKYGAKEGFDKLTQFTMKGITWADSLAVKLILPMAQKYVENHNPNLEVNSNQYIQEVAKVFERAINRTQTGTTAMLRPEVYRGSNYLLKLVNFMGSEGLKNGNMIMDAHRNWWAKQLRFQKKPTEANKQDLYNAQKEYARKLNAVALSNILAVIIGALANAIFKGQWEKYIDDDGEAGLSDLGHAGVKLLSDFTESMLSSYFFGGEIWTAVEALVSRTTPDLEQSIPEIEIVSDAVSDLWKLSEAISRYSSISSNENEEAATNLFLKSFAAGGSVASLFGLSIENTLNQALGLAETASRITKGIEPQWGISAQYEILKMQRSISSTANRQYFYDLLYEASKLKDRTAYRNIRRDMLEKGITQSAIDAALAKRKKAERED